MKIFAIKTISSNCIACMAAAGQTARSGTKLFIPLLTITLSVVLLAACGGGGGGGNPPAGGLPGVTDLKIIPAEGSLQLSWTNPARDDIRDFNISWVSTSTTPPASDSGLTGDAANKSARAMTRYLLDGLTDGVNYTVSVSILYVGGGVSKVPMSLIRQPGRNTDNDTEPDSLDSDDDNDGVPDAMDAYPLDACASRDTDDDGDPDSVVAGCQTNLMMDLDDNSPAADRLPGVTDLKIIPAEGSLRLSWTNPDRADISDFNISWVSAGPPPSDWELTGTDASNSSGAMTDYVLDGLSDGFNYTVSVSILYAGGGLSNVTAGPMRRTGQNTDNDTLPDSLDLDDDNDDVPDGMDAFPLDACASVDTDGDNMTDEVVVGCQTELTVDSDDDNDGVGDTADDCPRGDTGWISNASTDNDNDGCRDATVEDLDDDNDGVDDADDDFRTDACASLDTDNDSAPDSLVADCQTNLTADADDDNDGVEDTADVFPTDRCASVDTDGDELPDQLVAGCDTDLEADPDDDNDLVLDGADMDDNNNSLIEIHTLDDLARLRDDLNGDGTDDDNIDAIAAVGNTGCPASGCNGYELTRSLNFSDAESYDDDSGNSKNMAVWTNRSGSGWQPIGSCSAPDTCNTYTAVLDGRDHTIADLFISVRGHLGAGLFAAFNGSVQNLHLLNANIMSAGFGTYMGLVAGYGRNARYENLSVTGGTLINIDSTSMGSLVGDGVNAKMRRSYASGVTVRGNSRIGGLVGHGNGMDIRHSYIVGASVTGLTQIGGLVGVGNNMDIRYSYIIGGTVSALDADVGGLIGTGEGAKIRSSYAAGGSVSSDGASSVGGLIGSASPATVVAVSYWDKETTGRSTSAGGGEGQTVAMLQNPTNFTGIYADWGDLRCDPATGEVRQEDTMPTGFLSLWNLGTAEQYPALNCMVGGLIPQGRDKP